MTIETATGSSLVWLPFDPSALGATPPGLRFEKVPGELYAEAPASVAEVEFFVPAYSFQFDVGAVMARMPRLRVVQALTAGVDHLRSVLPGGVTLCTGRGIHDAATAEMALTLILASQRGVPTFVRNQAEGRWDPGAQIWPSLADRRVLIVGAGAIGSAIEARLLPFETEVIKVARTARHGVHPMADLPELLPGADVVVLVVPLTDETRGLVDDAFLSRMKDGALLVNVARGPVLDDVALLGHLGRIRAAIDVADPEPLPPQSPLWRAPDLLITPHVAGGTTAMRSRANRLLGEQLRRFADGADLLNVAAGY